MFWEQANIRLNLLRGLGSVFKPFVLSGASNKDKKLATPSKEFRCLRFFLLVAVSVHLFMDLFPWSVTGYD